MIQVFRLCRSFKKEIIFIETILNESKNEKEKQEENDSDMFQKCIYTQQIKKILC